MHTDMEARACDLAEYLLANNATVRAAAKQFGVSKSTVHKDLTERLEKIDPALYQQVRQLLDRNKAERHIRGGMADAAKIQRYIIRTGGTSYRKNGDTIAEGDPVKGKRIGRQTVQFSTPPVIRAAASVVGRKEGEGPLRDRFDSISQDTYFGEKSWEQAESAMLRQCFARVWPQGGAAAEALDYVLSGDLLNQCVGSAYAMRGRRCAVSRAVRRVLDDG